MREAAVNGGTLRGFGRTRCRQDDAARRRGTSTPGRRERPYCASSGTELEGELSYAALNQALYPLVEEFDELNTAQRDALQVALGFGDGPPPGRLLVSNAATVLLRRAAARSPLLLIVDDIPWIDRASAGVLSFVARRLAGSRAGLLAAGRTGEDQGFFDRRGTAGVRAEALGRHGRGSTPRQLGSQTSTRRSRLGFSTRRKASHSHCSSSREPEPVAATAGEPLPAVLPLGQNLQRHFVSRVAKLPDATRKLLLTAALEGTGDLGVLEAANDGRVPDRRSGAGRAGPAGAGEGALAPGGVPASAHPLGGCRGDDLGRTPFGAPQVGHDPREPARAPGLAPRRGHGRA